MAVRIRAGENRIEFRYTVPGLKAGAMLSLLALAVSVIYIIAAAMLDRKRGKAA